MKDSNGATEALDRLKKDSSDAMDAEAEFRVYQGRLMVDVLNDVTCVLEYLMKEKRND
jgi:hypothetical protein